MDACGVGVDNWFRRCFHNCRLQDCRGGSQFGEKKPVRIIVSAGRWDTPHIDSLLPVFEGKRPRKAVFWLVATCPKSRTGYHPFPQVRAFTPHCWLPTGYHPEPGFHGFTRTWQHGLIRVGRGNTIRKSWNYRVGIIFVGKRAVLMYSHHLAPTITY